MYSAKILPQDDFFTVWNEMQTRASELTMTNSLAVFAIWLFKISQTIQID
jgi:hypothetical protein